MGLFSSHREPQHRPRFSAAPKRPPPAGGYLDEEDEDGSNQQAEQRPLRIKRNDGDGDRAHRPRLSASKAISKAREYLESMTGRAPEAVSGLTPGKEGWKVTLDVVELERIPPTTDVLASYDLELDEQGELIGYHRLGRFYRNQVDER